MSEGYRPDGPTTNKVRGLIKFPRQARPDAEKLAMALAREIDTLREYVAGLEQHPVDHEDPELVGYHYGDGEE